MAGTHYYFNVMNKDAIIFWGSLFVWWIVLSIVIISMAKSCTTNNNSPVERIHHNEIVTVVDSILDARFNSGCCEEVIDPHTRNGKVMLPVDY